MDTDALLSVDCKRVEAPWKKALIRLHQLDSGIFAASTAGKDMKVGSY